ncbi:MAG TPA: DUF4190 domain-containing protein [Phycisphaerae bacterium]|nr:DUF4190 domain-containing protein [Phycisphaerae bacterium]
MSINFNCPACGRVIAAEVNPGTQVSCPLCNQVVVVPAAGGTPMPVAPVQVVPWPGRADEPPKQGLAIGALVCGIAGWVACPLVGIVGLVLGIVALARINREPARYSGKGMAVGGIVTGALAIVLVPLMLLAVVPAFSQLFSLGTRAMCMENMKSIGQALTAYAQSNGGFPEAGADWQKRLINSGGILPGQLRCPTDESGAACSYIYVPASGVKADPNQILVYESPGNHGGGGGNILYRDGSVRFVKSPQFEKLIQAIKPPEDSAPDP